VLTREQAVATTARLHAELLRRRAEVAVLDGYYRGKHPLVFASEAWRHFNAGRYKDFSDNWCGVVGSSPAERLRIDGFALDDSGVVSDAERSLWSTWLTNEMEAQASQGILEAIVSKRSAVLVWGDENDEPVITWEHPSQVIVDYAPGGWKARAALKAWTDPDADKEFATLYTAEQVWKWQRPAGHTVTVTAGRTDAGLYVPAGSVVGPGVAWEQRQEPDEPWPLPNPMGVLPIVELRNRPMLGGEPLSDIDGARAMQDAINLLWAYLFGAADHASLPARVVMGQEPPSLPILGDDGQVIGKKPVDMDELAQKRLLWLNGQNTTIGQWEAAKLDVFTEVINVAVRHVAAQTRTPVHYVVGELTNINGETLLAGESGLTAKCREFQRFGGPTLRQVFARMALVRGQKDLAAACLTGRVQWADAETRTMSQASDAALKAQQVGMPWEWIAERYYGLSGTELERVKKMRDAEQANPALQAAMAAIQASADRAAAAQGVPEQQQATGAGTAGG
jgi:hypothetical protein